MLFGQLSIFVKIKLLITNRDSSIVVFCHCCKDNFCLRNKYNVFYRSTGSVENLFNFATCFVGENLAKLVILVQFNITIANNGLREPYLQQANSSFPLHLYVSQGMFSLAQICENSKAKIWKAACHQAMLCSLIKHAVSANQSVHYMETLLETFIQEKY